ncbi:hypothetical protein ACFVS2_22265 [Brevibacillus sp. NPDC058079]|uniref:hypothetical protein n=1 Tax=Brevibacillus sp. NPDC058079 TaxID=3346330 RepID=UPI0036F18E1C
MDNVQLAFFFFFVWLAFYIFGLTIFRLNPAHYKKEILISTLLMTPISWGLAQLMKINTLFHILNAPVEIFLGSFLLYRFFFFRKMDSALIIILSYGIGVILDYLIIIVTSKYNLAIASDTIATGMITPEWFWVLFTFIISFVIHKKEWGFPNIKIGTKKNHSLGYEICLFMAFICIWSSNIAVHFPSYLLAYLIFFVFLVLCYFCIRLYNREAIDDFL